MKQFMKRVVETVVEGDNRSFSACLTGTVSSGGGPIAAIWNPSTGTLEVTVTRATVSMTPTAFSDGPPAGWIYGIRTSGSSAIGVEMPSAPLMSGTAEAICYFLPGDLVEGVQVNGGLIPASYPNFNDSPFTTGSLAGVVTEVQLLEEGRPIRLYPNDSYCVLFQEQGANEPPQGTPGWLLAVTFGWDEDGSDC